MVQVEVVQCLNRLACIYEKELDDSVPLVVTELNRYLLAFAASPSPSGEDIVMAILEYTLGIEQRHATHMGDHTMSLLVQSLCLVLL